MGREGTAVGATTVVGAPDERCPAALMLFPPAGDDPQAAIRQDLPEGASTRDAILALTMREVARVGPASFSTRTVCRMLDLTHPIINYHFGSRDALIAEAGHLLYARLVRLQSAALDDAPPEPLARLRTFLDAGMRLAVEMRGWGAVLNYFPYYSDTVADAFSASLAEAHRELYFRHSAVFARLVFDVWEGTVTPPDPDAPAPTEADALRFAAEHPELSARLASFQFLLHGLAVWRSGHLPPGGPTPEQAAALDAVVAEQVGLVVHAIAAAPPR